MVTRRLKAISWLVVVLIAAAPVAAHEGLHEQIAEVTKEIKREPKNASLYLKRGELHRLHRDWAAALADYRRAEALDKNLDLVQFGRGRMFLEAGKPRQAKLFLDRFLTRHPDHVDALVARARALVKLAQNLSAAKDYSRAIAKSPRARPEYYIERARALAAAGGAYNREALSGIDEGIKALGPIVTLELFAIELELAGKNYDAALGRVDRVAAQSARKESWLAWRGEILRQAGREAEARDAFKAALAAIETLPTHTRKSKAVLRLETQVRAALER